MVLLVIVTSLLKVENAAAVLEVAGDGAVVIVSLATVNAAFWLPE